MLQQGGLIAHNQPNSISFSTNNKSSLRWILPLQGLKGSDEVCKLQKRQTCIKSWLFMILMLLLTIQIIWTFGSLSNIEILSCMICPELMLCLLMHFKFCCLLPYGKICWFHNLDLPGSFLVIPFLHSIYVV